MTNYARNLRAARDALGISQAELGRRAGVRTATVSDIETHTSGGDPETKRKLAAALGTTVVFLMREK